MTDDRAQEDEQPNPIARLKNYIDRGDQENADRIAALEERVRLLEVRLVAIEEVAADS